MSIINTIHVERAKLRISQQDLAGKVGVSRQTIHSIERGKKIPSVELALKISHFFNVPLETLFHIGIDTKPLKNK